MLTALLKSVRVTWCDQKSDELAAFHSKSWIGYLVERVFAAAQFLSISTWIWGTRTSHYDDPPEAHKRRSRRVDTYIFLWLLALIGWTAWMLLTWAWSDWIQVAGILGLCRIVDILQAQINMHLFDGMRQPTNQVGSIERSTLIAFINYIEIIGWGAVLYLWLGDLKSGASDPTPFEALYFSTVTQLTIGFGDIKPDTTWARSLAMAQGLVGTMLIVFAISRFVSVLPRVSQVGNAGDNEAERIADAVIRKLKEQARPDEVGKRITDANR